MIFLDSNIPMYLVGTAHPHKIDARRMLEQSIAAGERLCTDAEVLQEILHRYAAINRRDAIQPAFEVILNTADQIFSIEREDSERAKDIVLGYNSLSARDALHIAVMERYGISTILTFDRGYSLYPGITVLDS
jgi:predicted nucleic acid-binding protein